MCTVHDARASGLTLVQILHSRIRILVIYCTNNIKKYCAHLQNTISTVHAYTLIAATAETARVMWERDNVVYCTLLDIFDRSPYPRTTVGRCGSRGVVVVVMMKSDGGDGLPYCAENHSSVQYSTVLYRHTVQYCTVYPLRLTR